MPCFTVQPIQLATSTDDKAGVLVLLDGELAAVVSRLDASYHGELRGRWFLEAGFGRCDVPPPAPQNEIADVVAWIAERLDTDSTLTLGECSPSSP